MLPQLFLFFINFFHPDVCKAPSCAPLIPSSQLQYCPVSMSEGSFPHSDETQHMFYQIADHPPTPHLHAVVALQLWQAQSTLTKFVSRDKQSFIITREIALQVIAARLYELIFCLNTVYMHCDSSYFFLLVYSISKSQYNIP